MNLLKLVNHGWQRCDTAGALLNPAGCGAL
jgi:hypothetical protein